MNKFNELGVGAVLVNALTKIGINEPTPIQAATIPVAMQGRDVLGSAATGTGKTLAFSVPMVDALLRDSNRKALILVPTRELAQQVTKAVTDLATGEAKLSIAMLIGGEPYPKQLYQLRKSPRIIVGTPGRVIDMLKRGALKTQHLNFLVLDETDRMFDLGFGIQLEEIISQLPESRQNLMFSATIAPSVEKLAKRYLHEPERIAVDQVSAPSKQVNQEIIYVAESDKYKRLLVQLGEREGSVIIFVKTKAGAEKLAGQLCSQEHTASALHGDLRQHKRERVIKAFRHGRHRILVATDIAARGLDIPHIRHVINYDLPQCPEDYIHRIGRTGRAGASGDALCLIAPHDRKKWQQISFLIDPEAAKAAKAKQPREDFGDRMGRSRDARKPFRRGGSSAAARPFGRSRPAGSVYRGKSSRESTAGQQSQPRQYKSGW